MDYKNIKRDNTYNSINLCVSLEELLKSSIKKIIIKTIIYKKLLCKKGRERILYRIYTNFPTNERECDIFFEDIRGKKILIFEIINKESEEEIKKIYEDYDVWLSKIKLVILKENEFGDSLDEIENKIEKLITEELNEK